MASFKDEGKGTRYAVSCGNEEKVEKLCFSTCKFCAAPKLEPLAAPKNQSQYGG